MTPPTRPVDAGERQPIAVLLCLDGSERVLPLMKLPPPSELRLPSQYPASTEMVEPSPRLPIHRTFRLTTFFDRSRRWQNHSSGAGYTLEPAFVYMENRL